MTVVLDIGSLHTSIGFAGDSAPKIFTSSYVASDTSLKSNEVKSMAGN